MITSEKDHMQPNPYLRWCAAPLLGTAALIQTLCEVKKYAAPQALGMIVAEKDHMQPNPYLRWYAAPLPGTAV